MDVITMTGFKQTNRLIKKKSPYLREHAHNPVDWYQWGDEDFEKARREGNRFSSVSDIPDFNSCNCSTLTNGSYEYY